MWLRLDDGFYEHPKVADLTDSAFRLWVSLLGYSARYCTGGALTRAQIARVSRAASASRRARDARALLACGLLVALDGEDGDRFQLHDWHEFNPTAEQAKRLSDQRAAAGRQGGLRSGEVRRAAKHAKQTASSPVEPRPVPSPDTPPTPLPPGQVITLDEATRTASAVAWQLARQEVETARGVVDRSAYTATVARRIWGERQADLVALAREHPARTIRQLAGIAGHPAGSAGRLPTCPTCALRHSAGPCPFADDPLDDATVARIHAELEAEELGD